MSRAEGGDREHLFRDEAGAALERASRLQEENSQLRAEIEQLRRFGPPASSPDGTAPQRNDRRDVPTLRTRRPTSQAVAATLFALGAAVGVLVALRVSVQQEARPAPPERGLDGPIRPPPVMMMDPGPLPTPTTTIIGASTPDDEPPPGGGDTVEADLTPAPTLDDCSLLYYYDSANVKHYKTHCLNANAPGAGRAAK